MGVLSNTSIEVDAKSNITNPVAPDWAVAKRAPQYLAETDVVCIGAVLASTRSATLDALPSAHLARALLARASEHLALSMAPFDWPRCGSPNSVARRRPARMPAIRVACLGNVLASARPAAVKSLLFARFPPARLPDACGLFALK